MKREDYQHERRKRASASIGDKKCTDIINRGGENDPENRRCGHDTEVILIE